MALTDNQKAKLEMDAAKGEDYQRIWDTYILPFFDEKQKELYEVFIEMPTSDRDSLLSIKMQQNSLLMMKDHFESFIKNGRMASQQLKENENGQ